jgi:hypothetical protein
MAQGSTPESAGSARPFKYHGKQGEFTLLAPFKPGGAEKAREIAREANERFTEISDAIYGIGTLHDIRIASFDNDTRLLFVTKYDGDWDQYIDDFAAGSAAGNLRFLDELFGTLEGFPGLASPDVKDYLAKYQVPVGFFWTAQPDSTIKRNLRAERVLGGFEQVLDAAG